ncbi:16754_t:CDS:2, partial [Gigaspora rosea]
DKSTNELEIPEVNNETRQQVVQVPGAEEPEETGTEDTTSNMKLDNENELSSNGLDENSGTPGIQEEKDLKLFGARNTSGDQHEVQLPNKEISIEDNKQVLEAQHEKQIQDTNIAVTEMDRIDEAGEGPTQSEGPNIMLTDMKQNKHDRTPEKAIQVVTNSDTTEKNGMDLEGMEAQRQATHFLMWNARPYLRLLTR